MNSKRMYIGIFGRRNQGKSSLINAIANQNLSIVSEIAGTTTDPVKKSIEIFGIGPTVMIDTAGIDDSGKMGEKRVAKSIEILKIVDTALLVISNNLFGNEEEALIAQFNNYSIPYVIVHNKSDLTPLEVTLRKKLEFYKAPIVECSSTTRSGIDFLIQSIKAITPPSAYFTPSLLGDVVKSGDSVLLIMPQDSEAPEGRLILPQVQMIRDLLDHHVITTCIQPEEIKSYLQYYTPSLVITDSQVFSDVSRQIPIDIPLTSFSIVLARSKGNFNFFLQGTPYISQLQDGDTILMLESCTHITSCEDIGRHKIPQLLQNFTKKTLNFEYVAALSPLPDLKHIKMAIQCGGCMVTSKQLMNRIQLIISQNIPISNYGMSIAYTTGIFDRTTQIFKQLLSENPIR